MAKAAARSQALDATLHSAVVTMRIERFHSSVWESSASLMSDAGLMLKDEEFVNFFLTCGPNYIRSIERVQEVTALFTYTAADASHASSFNRALKLYIHGNRYGEEDESTTTDFPILDFDSSEILSSLSVEITGFGLGLNLNGDDSLVATGLSEFSDAMKFAFDSMTKNEEHVDENSSQMHTGMISKIEVVPWADNAEFLDYSKVDFNKILAPIPRHLMPDNEANADETLTCADKLYQPDDFGKCCDPNEVYNITLDSGAESKVCEAVEYLSPITLKQNMEINAEFVAWMGLAVRQKLKSLSTLTQCVTSLRAMPSSVDYEFLQEATGSAFNPAIDMQYAVNVLRAALDPTKDMEILGILAGEIDEYLEMFYQPCLAALYGRNALTGETDPSLFMGKAWFNLDECIRPSCLEEGMAWDRKDGNGCVTGILTRDKTDADSIPSSTDQYCAKEIDSYGFETCKHIPSVDVFVQLDTCRSKVPQVEDGKGNLIPPTLSYLIDYFCMPTSTGVQGTSEEITAAETAVSYCAP